MNVNRKIIFFLTLLIGVFQITEIAAQKTKARLKRERLKSLKKIKETENILKETKKQKSNSLGELNALNQRIKQQETLTQSIHNEINLLNIDINENEQIVESLGKDLALLKKEYARMLFSTQKASGKLGKLMFLFSSASFNQLLMRLRYIEQYSASRKNQAKVIMRIQGVLASQINQTRIIKEEKNVLLNNQIMESRSLIDLKQKQNSLIQRLEQDERKLKKDLVKTQKAIAQLDHLISGIIRKEIKRAEKKSLKKNKSNNITLSSTFKKNKSKLPRPAAGFISQRFGKQEHPILKGIEIYNDGINIQTRKNAIVKSVFKGEVRAVAFIPSIGNSVIVGHGEYFTVYSGLKDVKVKRSQQIKSNQEIGRVLTNADGISELRFQIRKNTEAVNPEKWLKK